MKCFHNWKSVTVYLGLPLGQIPDLYICNKCGHEGRGWYDMLSGGVNKLKGFPKTDLRVQAKIEGNQFI